MCVKSRALMVKQKLDLISKLEDISLKPPPVMECKQLWFMAVGTINKIVKYANNVS
jgi:hypothetical protein